CPLLRSVKEADINTKPNNLDRRFRIYRETLSRFWCITYKEVILEVFISKTENGLGKNRFITLP
ncbi:hypothetical protein ACO1D1_10600, partial [Neobacillus sp. 19]